MTTCRNELGLATLLNGSVLAVGGSGDDGLFVTIAPAATVPLLLALHVASGLTGRPPRSLAPSPSHAHAHTNTLHRCWHCSPHGHASTN